MSKRPGNGKGLSPQQQRFVDAYLADPAMNVKDAMRVAGYGEGYTRGNCHRMLDNPAINAAVQAEMEKRSARTQITQDYVLQNAREVVERCMQRAPVLQRDGTQVKDDDGRNVWQFDARGATAALTLLGKHVGIGVANLNVNIDTAFLQRVIVVPETLPPEQWEAQAIASQQALIERKKLLAAEYGVDG